MKIIICLDFLSIKNLHMFSNTTLPKSPKDYYSLKDTTFIYLFIIFSFANLIFIKKSHFILLQKSIIN